MSERGDNQTLQVGKAEISTLSERSDDPPFGELDSYLEKCSKFFLWPALGKLAEVKNQKAMQKLA